MNNLLHQAKTFISRNAPTILTCVGGAGVVVTAVMAAKATPKALSLIEHAKEEKGEELTKWETVKTAGVAYVPAAVTGAATIACIFGSNIISKHQQATLMSAYALLDNSYKEYKKKVDELYGEEAGKNVRAEIAKDKYAGDDHVLDDNTELFYDFYSGRFFNSTKEAVLMAEYETNRALTVNGAVGLNEYYSFLGINPRPEYDEIGWSCAQMFDMYWHPWIEFNYENGHIDEDGGEDAGMEYTLISMPLEPVMDYLDY